MRGAEGGGVVEYKKFNEVLFFGGQFERRSRPSYFAVGAGGGQRLSCGVRRVCRAGGKGRLAELWARIDGVICGLTERDRLALKKYAAMRGGADGEEKREQHRAAVKFARRAQGLRRGGLDDYKLLCAYLCLISSAPV